LLLVCDPSRARIESYATPVLGYKDLIAVHEALLETIKPAPVVGIALNTRGLSEAQARAEIARARDETQLPAGDVVRFGAEDFYSQISARIVKRAPLGGRRES
jgi:uncharacterized NAD-dependent epimerase/dehydratase family protein